MNTPFQVIDVYRLNGAKKAMLPAAKAFILAIFAGIFIALAGLGSSAASATLSGSAAKLVSACVFPAGLAMVVLAGGELFTGNNLIIISVLDKRITWGKMLRSWLIVYLGNFVGSLLVAAAAVLSHSLSLFGGELAASVISSAVVKVSLPFCDAFTRGILCNFLVCIAVWCAMSAKSAGGKVAALYFPIMLFVLCAFEHCVANMYQIPAGIFALKTPAYASVAVTDVSALTFSNFFIKNLVPVTLGNIIGGAGFVGVPMWFVHLHKKEG